jgi:rhomboid protease GluP
VTEEPILIGEEHLDRRVELEQGMSPVPLVSLSIILLDTALLVATLVKDALATPASIVAAGAKDSSSIARGEVWRLVSPALLHGGVDHLIGNAIALYILGMGCEHVFGRARALVLFVATAVVGSLFSCASDLPSVGASGAVFGLMGALATAVVVRRDDLHVRDKRIGGVLFFWSAWSLVTGALDPMIDNLAHLGGFVSGCALGAVLDVVILPQRPASTGPAQAAALVAAGALAWALVMVVKGLASL